MSCTLIQGSMARRPDYVVRSLHFNPDLEIRLWKRPLNLVFEKLTRNMLQKSYIVLSTGAFWAKFLNSGFEMRKTQPATFGKQTVEADKAA